MNKIEKTLAAGGAVVLPTETVYGLFAQALNEEAVERVYELKRRPRDKALNLNVASLEEIYAFSKNQPSYLDQLYHAFLPGPLTIILQANDRVPTWINSGMGTVGFRIPKHLVTLDLIRKYGPLIGPSANLSGKVSGTSFQQIVMDFQEQVSGVEDDTALTGQDSTILDLSGEKAHILRQGTITREDILAQVNDINF
ncbi:L-threonylcarbamoyladenylate synthase [Streptococcus gordonii]|uniref:L-threonylcarbamoyladenylate synthase n=1 Tax=Streptococcus gordonii TaxID=1302 RepID=UPI001CC072A3|nr:L-threonylcarbamoyladenylate synthase [Streptococcus gordonii]MBZ2133176.1 threonylcarbamoyl-AMP synthase [Streptococcus gordonii]MBZ2142783.1 threonylcarbamoyl-AMP synthase [Streptococcus gordonii]MBZ2143538.1 threonylcarbamoyl-AMP synthase [Streptococcus gordonii]MBZ2145016.1 threonylcarbamoyl-AMP synthase [Streptococcus gordonii]